MAFVYSDRVKEESSSVGVTPVVLTGALPGFRDFATGVGDTNETYYTIFNAADNTWEVGIGTYSAGGNSLSRDTIVASSNANAAVNFAVGTKTVFSTVASQFFGAALTASSHSTLNHAGIPGVGGAETFTSADHDLSDHTAIPFSLLDAPGHEAIDHTLPPISLLNETVHDALDHTGLTGVNSFDDTQHAIENHAGLPGVPGPETFTSAGHALVDHTLGPFNLLNTAAHAAVDHSTLTGAARVMTALHYAADWGGGAGTNYLRADGSISGITIGSSGSQTRKYVAFDGELVAVTYNSAAVTTRQMDVLVNGSAATGFRFTLDATKVLTPTPVAFSAGDYIEIQSVSGAGAGDPSDVSALVWIRSYLP